MFSNKNRCKQQVDNIALECQEITHRFGYFLALKNLSFLVNRGSITGIVGGNGAGKTTLIKILAGMLLPTQGSVTIEGKTYHDHAREIRKSATVLLDDSFLFPDLTVFENLLFYANIFGFFDKREIRKHIQDLTEKFEVSQWIDMSFKVLSKGLQHRIELIRCFVTNPKILYLDEPDAHLDFRSQAILRETLEDLRTNYNATIFLATHNLDFATQLCDEILILKQGRLNLSIKKADYSQKTLREYY